MEGGFTMQRAQTLTTSALLVAFVGIGVVTPGALAVTEDFNGLPPGTVVAGDLPSGGTANNHQFADFALSVQNNGGAVHNSCILFDSSNPTGSDWDLGTPNQDFGGPGQGASGASGTPGENNTAYGNLLIVAENLIDADMDDVVDDPDDEVGGGLITFDFDGPTTVLWVKVIDIDTEEGGSITLYDGVNLAGTAPLVNLGNNSYQMVDLANMGPVTKMEVFFSASGGIAEIEYRRTTATESSSWSDIKKRFR